MNSNHIILRISLLYLFLLSAWNIVANAQINITHQESPLTSNSILFDATNAVIWVGDGSPINALANQDAYKVAGKSITVEAWVCPMGYPTWMTDNTIVERLDYGAGAYKLFVSQAAGNPHAAFSISDGTTAGAATVVCDESLSLFQWVHLAGTYDGTSLCIYVNGQLRKSTSTNITISKGAVQFSIGKSGWYGSGFAGMIGDVRLWNITRSQASIRTAMNDTLIGNETGLVGYWKLNAISSGSVATDATSNHNDLWVTVSLWGPGGISSAQLVPINHTTQVVTPAYSLGSPTIDFGTAEQGSSAVQMFTITNSTTQPTVGILEYLSSDVKISKTFYLPANQTSNVQVAATPIIAGKVSGVLNLHIMGSNPQQIPFVIQSIALRRFDGNNIAMWTMRDGRFAWNPLTGNGGLEWPKNSGKTAVYECGMTIGAMVQGSISTASAFYWTEFTPGPIIGGVAANPTDTTFRVYKIQAGDNASTNADYASWPSSLGAPVNPDGSPMIIGNQTIFAVYNDLTTNPRRFGTAPLGAEVQQTIFGFDRPDALANTVFLRFKIINKSSSTWTNAYVSFWSDPDLGYPSDDLVSVDTVRCMGVVYNGLDTDAIYGSLPPAAGFQIMKGAYYTKPIQAFAYFINGAPLPRNDPNTAAEFYNFMQGKWSDGTPYIDFHNDQATTFALNGDPVTGTGWNDMSPGDRRFLFSTGPFDLDPGQSKEMIAAIIMGQGTDRLNSVTVVRAEADSIKAMYNAGQIFGGTLDNVVAKTAQTDSTSSINDLTHSGTQMTFKGGIGGATVDAAMYMGAPPGAQTIATPSSASVGKYLDAEVQGAVVWPVQIRMYYTKNDLLQAGISESDLQGVYYWSGATNRWILYSNSGSDDQGREASTTRVDTTNVTINGVLYEGSVLTSASHLAPFVIGSIKHTTGTGKIDVVPTEFCLSQNYPNPFNPSTTIQYGLPAQSSVRLVIYNVLGQVVKELINTEQQAGYQSAVWNANVSSGMYFYRIEATSKDDPSKRFVETKKMLLLK